VATAPGGDRRVTWVDLPAARPAHDPEVPEAIGAGFTHGTDPFPVLGAAAFEAGGAADVMPPCSVLAELTGQALEAGLERLSDDELVGVMRASHRVLSWQSLVELAAVEELAARRRAEGEQGGPRPDDRAAAEIAAALTLTGRSASILLGTAFGVVRMPEVAAALAAGEIDLARATVFVEELAQLGWLQASFIGGKNLLAARGLTTSQLRDLLRREVLAADPEAVRRRQRAARADARVQSWSEASGNGALAGRELSPDRALLADRHIGALASALKAAGMPGTLDQIRAEVFVTLLSGQSPQHLLPAGPGLSPAYMPAAGALLDEVMGAPSGAAIPEPDAEDLLPGLPPDDLPPADPSWQDLLPAGIRADDLLPAGRAARNPSWPAGPLGTVHLTIPWSTWLGLCDRPGEVAGHGPVDAWTGRELAQRLRESDATRYCVTVTTDDGHPLGHACATTPPPSGAGPPAATGPPSGAGPPSASGPPVDTERAAAWIAGLGFEWLSSGACDHSRQTPAYRPGRSLDHLIKIRNPTCTAPGCKRPAWQCDIDHVVPFHLGGRTCECNCHPACRRHHRCKGSRGWHLDMPAPGVLAWRLPHGRTYLTSAEPYPV
jgi:Domain of unknown function (DUF222)